MKATAEARALEAKGWLRFEEFDDGGQITADRPHPTWVPTNLPVQPGLDSIYFYADHGLGSGDNTDFSAGMTLDGIQASFVELEIEHRKLDTFEGTAVWASPDASVVMDCILKAATLYPEWRPIVNIAFTFADNREDFAAYDAARRLGADDSDLKKILWPLWKRRRP
jgi:hypothetical protein